MNSVGDCKRDPTEACNCLHLSWRGVTWEKYRSQHPKLQPHTNILVTHILIEEWKIYSLHMPHLWGIKVRITGNYIQCLDCMLVCYGFSPPEYPPLPLLPLHFGIPIIYHSLGIITILNIIWMSTNMWQSPGLASLHLYNYTKKQRERRKTETKSLTL